MSDNTNITPENSPDQALTQAYGELLKGALSVGDIRDPLYKLLEASKRELVEMESSIEIRGKDRVWNNLQSEIGTPFPSQNISAGSKARILPMSTESTWFRAAAAILLIILPSLIAVMLIREPGPELLASAGSAVEVIELGDGSSVTLRPNSSIYELSLAEDEHLYRLDGEALFSVTSNSSREFTVRAGRGEVTVLGTRFNLSERSGRTRVDLLEGSVRFANRESREEVILEPGQAAEITDTLSLNGPFEAAIDDITGWTQNRLTFRNRTLNDILSELEFHYGIRIDVPASLKEEYLGGSVTLESREQTLQDLGTVLGGRFVETETGEFEFRAN